MWYVYILKSIDRNWYYVGSTNSLERRLNEHNKGKVSSTKSKIPLEIVKTFSFESENEARLYEHRIKSQRKLKEEILRNL